MGCGSTCTTPMGKLWKVISYYNDFHNHPPLGRTIDGVASTAYDLQNTHMTVWCGYANAGHLMPYIDNEAPKEYMKRGEIWQPGWTDADHAMTCWGTAV